MNDKQRLDELKHLLSIVVNNTKRAVNGKAGNDTAERKGVKTVLSAMFNRSPTEEEIQSALKF
jgi:hypothetical protein